jgi:hypothetical protein
MSREDKENDSGGLKENMAKQIYRGSTDKRIIRMKILNGQLKEEDLKDYLEGLPDVSANTEQVTVVMDKKGSPVS